MEPFQEDLRKPRVSYKSSVNRKSNISNKKIGRQTNIQAQMPAGDGDEDLDMQMLNENVNDMKKQSKEAILDQN